MKQLFKGSVAIILTAIFFLLCMPSYVAADQLDYSDLSDVELIMVYLGFKSEMYDRGVLEIKPKELPKDYEEAMIGFVTKNCDFVLNANTHKIHLPTCNSVRDMNISNMILFTGTLQEALKLEKYQLCNSCNKKIKR